MRWLGYPLYRLLFFMIVGIVGCHARSFRPSDLYWILGLAFLAATFFLFFKKFSSLSKNLFGFSITVFFIGLGMLMLSLRQQLPENHFKNSEVFGKEGLLQLTLNEPLAPNSNYLRFYANIEAIDGNLSRGKVLVLLPKTDTTAFAQGDKMLVYEQINPVNRGRNPGDFDYGQYLQRIDVYGQVYVDTNTVLLHQDGSENLSWWVQWRNHIQVKLENTQMKADSKGLIQALVLGQRQNLNPEVSKNFRDAGVIHILALSGLHVGIILLILRFLTRPLLRMAYGRWLQSLLIITLLWGFAFITGLSPSILRAVTMFSAVAIGMNIKRKSSVFHSLTISAMALLLFDPRLLFQIGFQLSYMAVFSIVLIQPVLSGLWRVSAPSWWRVMHTYFWNIFTVTLAAQIGVAPISIYYFHQFPGLFLVGNLLLLPLLPLIIGACLLLIGLLLLDGPSLWLQQGLDNLLGWIVSSVEQISSYQSFLIKDLYLDSWELILLYIALFSGALFFLPYFKRSRKERFFLQAPNGMMHLALLCIIILVAVKTYQNVYANDKGSYVLHLSKASAISQYTDDQAILFVDLHNLDSLKQQQSLKRLKAVEFHRGKKMQLMALENTLGLSDALLIVIDEDGVYKKLQPNNVILLSHAPKINLERLILELQPQYIIADGSNYRNLVEMWEKTCKEQQIPFINTYEEGAVAID